MYVRQLKGLDEAIKSIPLEIRARYSQVECRKTAELRDIVVHNYFIIDDRIVWDILK